MNCDRCGKEMKDLYDLVDGEADDYTANGNLYCETCHRVRFVDGIFEQETGYENRV